MRLVLVWLIKNVCLFCRLGYMCLNFAYTRYKKCGSLEFWAELIPLLSVIWFTIIFSFINSVIRTVLVRGFVSDTR